MTEHNRRHNDDPQAILSFAIAKDGDTTPLRFLSEKVIQRCFEILLENQRMAHKIQMNSQLLISTLQQRDRG